MIKLTVNVFFVWICVASVSSENILCVANIPSGSHHIWNRALAQGLASKGHNITYISPNVDKTDQPNYTHITMEGVYKGLYEGFNVNELGENSALETLNVLKPWCTKQCHFTLKSDGLRTLLNYPPTFKFDLIVIDISVCSCLFPLIQRFHYPPTVGVSPFLLPNYMSYSFGNQLVPAYIPWYGLPYSSQMSFIERVWNFVFVHSDIIAKLHYLYSAEHDQAKTVFGKNIPSMNKFLRHVSLLLANTDPILDYPQPLTPNIIPVGGLHARKPKPIPQDLQKVLDEAKNGVIVFSLGTNYRSDMLDNKTQEEIFDALSKLSETVIWKFESDIEHVPKNVVVRKWIPQNDIIAHPKVKLFIGHGGALSTQETLVHGVPIVTVPFAFDQIVNTRMILDRKLGVTVDYRRITSQYFLNQIQEVLQNPIYTANAKKVAILFHGRPETPLERGVFWSEYVMHNGGAQFLNTVARDLPYYKSSGIDVISFLALIAFGAIFLLYKIGKLVFAQFQGRDKVKVN